VDLLENSVQPYAWGSRTAIAALRGLPTPSPGPEAELWLGTHPQAPSHVVRDGRRVPLAEVIARDPESELGARALAAHGPQLPFLLKVLAAGEPLSLQAHPDARRAREGFDREEAAGIPRGAPDRNYRDPWPKPELLCALEPFEALCGFRPAAEARALLDALGEPTLDPVRERLDGRSPHDALRDAFTWLATLPAPDRRPLVEATVAAAARASARPDAFADSFRWVPRLAALYPADPGVAIALLLRLVRLAPGEALYLPAGNLHAYLRGVGVEIMASSDNVLRGGLTPKHVDVPELLRVLRFAEDELPLVRPRPGWPGEEVYATDAAHFELSRIALSGAPFRASVGGPEIVLCTEGEVAASASGERLTLSRGQSVFVPARTGAYELTGTGVVFRAGVPRG
jgi:mannose-6-phosphate isomerase